MKIHRASENGNDLQLTKAMRFSNGWLHCFKQRTRFVLFGLMDKAVMQTNP